MATQAQLDRAFEWAKAQVGKTYSLGTFGNTFDCSTYMSGIATMIRDGVAKTWFTTHPFHSGSFSPLPGWEKDLQAPFMIGITADGIGHTGGTLLGVNFEATPPAVRSGTNARGAFNSMYEHRYGFRPSLLEGAPVPTEDVTYTVKAGDTLSAIATANNTTVAQLVTWNPQLLHVGDVLVVQKGVPVPPVPTVPQFPGVVKFYSVGPGTINDMNKIIQKCLNHFVPPVYVDGDWGPKTSAAYTKWQIACGWNVADGSADGKPGVQSMTKLSEKYGFTLDMAAPPAPTPGEWRTASEPAHNYTRTTYGGRTVNMRTKEMLDRAKAIYGSSFPMTQGSYNSGVGASAGTHDGGGVVDIGLNSSAAVQALRKAGFFAWQRTPADGFAYHIHAVAIGDREMSSAARSQVTQGFQDRNGLANRGFDSAADPYPNWISTYGTHISPD